MEEIVNNIEEKKEEREEKENDLVRVLMNKMSFDLLNQFLDKANEGNVGGKISKGSGLSWIVRKFIESAGELEIKQIRNDHFDELGMLEYVLKRAKIEGKVPDEWRAMLQKQLLNETAAPKKVKKSS